MPKLRQTKKGLPVRNIFFCLMLLLATCAQRPVVSKPKRTATGETKRPTVSEPETGDRAPVTFDSATKGFKCQPPETEIVSIVKVADYSGCTVECNSEEMLVGFSCKGVSLYEAMQWLEPETYWYCGLGLLPDGFYEIRIDTPVPKKKAFRLICDAIGHTFRLSITVKPYKWNGYRITVPDELPSVFKRVVPRSLPQYGTGGKGYVFNEVSFETVRVWIEDSLGAPAVLSRLPDGHYNFEVACNPIRDRADSVRGWFLRQGFKFKDTEIEAPSVVIEKR